jgi:hypothetical protein
MLLTPRKGISRKKFIAEIKNQYYFLSGSRWEFVTPVTPCFFVSPLFISKLQARKRGKGIKVLTN